MISRFTQSLHTALLAVVVLLLASTQSLQAQESAKPVSYKPEELEALVAPIALYPDDVLAQVLMASTYPLEIVHAARWSKEHPNLKGDNAIKAVQDQPWDVSVKSLVAFPQVLEPMNDKLDWTQKLGDAFLAQEKDVLAAVQRLRARARDSGNLKTNEQQKVTVEQAPPAQGAQGAPPAQAAPTTIVRIEPANPEVIYVPAYNPTVVYGAWSYPAYPPYYWPPSPAYYPGGALMTGFAWGVGLAAAGAIFGNANWGGGDVNIDVDRVKNVDRNFDRTKVQNGKWQHDPGHRQGVAYRDNATRQKYANNVAGADARRDYRGRTGTADRANGAGAGNRQGGLEAGNRAGGAGAGNRQGSLEAGNRAGGAGAGNRQGSLEAGNRAGGAGAGNRQSSLEAGNRASGAGAGNRQGGQGGQGSQGGLGGGDQGGAGRANQRDASNRGGGGYAGVGDRGSSFGGTGGGNGFGGGRDNAFQGVGGGAATQRDASRGRSSMQASSFNRPSGGGAGGAGGMRAGGGGMRAGGGGRGGRR